MRGSKQAPASVEECKAVAACIISTEEVAQNVTPVEWFDALNSGFVHALRDGSHGQKKA